MTLLNEKIQAVLKEGNKNLLYFLFIFVFIHFVIIIPYKHPVENNAIGQAGKTIESQISFLTSSIAKLENVTENLNTDYSEQTSKYIDTLSTSKESIKQERIYLLREKLIQHQKNYIEVSKQRVERTFNIPVLGISISESVILSIYPGFILVGLCFALFFRKKLLPLVAQLEPDERSNLSLPIWISPLPFSMSDISFRSWLFVNTIGLSIHCLIIYVGIDFLLFRGNKFDFEIIAVNIFIATIAIIVYLITFVQLISLEWKSTPK
jgi:hypothetical protein